MTDTKELIEALTQLNSLHEELKETNAELEKNLNTVSEAYAESLNTIKILEKRGERIQFVLHGGFDKIGDDE